MQLPAVGSYVIVPIPANGTVPSSLASHLNVSEWETPGKHLAWERELLQGEYCSVSRIGKKIAYKVGDGETLQSISNAFNVTVKDLLAWNYLANPQQSLKSGRTLFIYLPDSPAKASKTANNTEDNAKYSGKRVIRPGETVYGISIELGVPIIDFANINKLNERCPIITPGYVLRYAPPANKTKDVKK